MQSVHRKKLKNRKIKRNFFKVRKDLHWTGVTVRKVLSNGSNISFKTDSPTFQRDGKVLIDSFNLRLICAFDNVSTQVFCLLPFSVIFLSKIMHHEFICEITMFSSKLLSFHEFFIITNLLATFKPSFLIEASQILRGLNRFKFYHIFSWNHNVMF